MYKPIHVFYIFVALALANVITKPLTNKFPNKETFSYFDKLCLINALTF